MKVIKIFLLTAILVSFTACSNQSDIDEAVATAVAEALATPTAVPIPTATELPIYEGSPARRSTTKHTWGNIPNPLSLWIAGLSYWRASVKVIRVIDGDTIQVDPISHKTKLDIRKGTIVRYLHIDTPETVHPDKPVQCYGPESTLRNKQLVQGKTVTLFGILDGDDKNFDDSFDRYGRLLAYVYTDTHFVNGELVWGGFAYDYKFATGPGHIKKIISTWETDAKENKRGLWGKCS